jgi:hypothetical protein
VKKTTVIIAAVFLALFAVGTVFAQVCLSNSAAKVDPNGRTVSVMNTMSNQKINVEVHWSKTNNRTTGSEWAYEIGPLGRTTITLPANTTYTGYTVWSCN